ncbi:MAG: hypothetical protein ACTSU2_16660 [Promethearchaeota archaeon]
MRTIVYVMKIILAIIFVWMILMFGRIIDFNSLELASLKEIMGTLVNIGSYGMYNLFMLIWYGIMNLSAGPFIPMNGRYFSYEFHDSFLSVFYSEFFQNWFPKLTDYHTNPNSPHIITMKDYIANNLFSKDISLLSGNLYILIFQLIFLFMIIYGIFSLVSNDPKYSIRTVTLLNIIIILPLLLIGIQTMVQVFDPTFNLSQAIGIYNPSATPPKTNLLPYPLKSDIINMSISSNLIQFFLSPIYQIALSAFVYIEFSFQMSYVYSVTNPVEERADRLKRQLAALKLASKQAIVDLNKIKEEEELALKRKRMEKEAAEKGKKKKKKKKQYELEEKLLSEEEQKRILSVRKFISQGGEAFSYIGRLIEKKKLEREVQKRMEALSQTRRLSNYLNRLLENDPEAEFTLTAKSSAPTAGKLLSSTIFDILFRILGISLIVFLISETPWLLVNVFHVPEAISHSVEMYTHEVILVVFIPVLLLFPFISIIIRMTKASHLTKQLKEEAQRRAELELGGLEAYVTPEKKEEEEVKQE